MFYAIYVVLDPKTLSIKENISFLRFVLDEEPLTPGAGISLNGE